MPATLQAQSTKTKLLLNDGQARSLVRIIVEFDLCAACHLFALRPVFLPTVGKENMKLRLC